MITDLILGLAIIIFAGILAQWLAWRWHIPSILLLLVFGLLVGPLLGLVDPDTLLGDLLFPLVSLAVGIILFEGGLGLRFRDLTGIRGVVRNLITVGVLVTWGIATAAGYWVLHLDLELALVLGAILTVSGPTVILPVLRDVRPEGAVGSILRWEGILIDPVGATLALVVFDGVLQTNLRQATGDALISLLQIVIIGAALGWATARLMAYLLKRYLIPDHLQNAFTLMAVIAVFALSNLLAPESGLLATTMMGMVLANQKGASIKHIIEFKEDLGVILTSSIFVLLAARLQLNDLLMLGWPGLIFLGVLILLARPLSVVLSTLRSSLRWPEKAFLAWMAPRGIVAASVASLFAIELAHAGFEQANMLVSVTFLVIIGTVVVYGLSAGPLARRLGLAEADPQGLLLVGAHPGARQLAAVLQEVGFKVVLTDTNQLNCHQAAAESLQAYCGNILYEEFVEEIDLGGVGRLLAMTSNDEVNTLACLHMAEIFGRAHVYQLPPQHMEEVSEEEVLHWGGRLLFGREMTFRFLQSRLESGWRLQVLEVTVGTLARIEQARAEVVLIPLFILRDQRLLVISVDEPYEHREGDKMIAMVAPTWDMEGDITFDGET